MKRAMNNTNEEGKSEFSLSSGSLFAKEKVMGSNPAQSTIT